MEAEFRMLDMCESEYEEKKETLKILRNKREELSDAVQLGENRILQLDAQCQNFDDKVKVQLLQTIQKENSFNASKRAGFQMSKYIQQLVTEMGNEELASARDVDGFEAEVDKLINLFRDAGIFYGIDNLSNEKDFIRKKMEEQTKLKKEFEKKICFYKMKISSIRDEFNNRKLHPIQNLFEQEAQLCKQQLEIVKSQYSY